MVEKAPAPGAAEPVSVLPEESAEPKPSETIHSAPKMAPKMAPKTTAVEARVASVPDYDFIVTAKEPISALEWTALEDRLRGGAEAAVAAAVKAKVEAMPEAKVAAQPDAGSAPGAVPESGPEAESAAKGGISEGSVDALGSTPEATSPPAPARRSKREGDDRLRKEPEVGTAPVEPPADAARPRPETAKDAVVELTVPAAFRAEATRVIEAWARARGASVKTVERPRFLAERVEGARFAKEAQGKDGALRLDDEPMLRIRLRLELETRPSDAGAPQ